MQLWQNIPLALILLPLISSSLLATLKPRASRAILIAVLTIVTALSATLCWFIEQSGAAYTIAMGEIGAPFGNELFISAAEAVMSFFFMMVMLFSLLGGMHRVETEIRKSRQSLFYTVCALITAALNAMTFTNDIFTGYVFLEILTIGAGALIFVRSRKEAPFAAMRYLIMNLLGSGLFLLGMSIMYCLTGHLLFPQINESAAAVAAAGRYVRPLTVSVLLMSLGVAIKSALYPFHTWLPNAYSGATPTASSILSSLISKAYIFLFTKIVLRGVGEAGFASSTAGNVIFVYACVAIVLGSVDALREHSVRRMVSYSSVAQIGYIFLAASLGTKAGMAAAIFHIMAHSVAKAMLFPAVDRLIEVSGGENFHALRGSGLRAPLAGIAFTVGALSITGIPLLGGFSSKVYISLAAAETGGWQLAAVLAVLAISTLLNVMYFLRTVVTLYRPDDNAVIGDGRVYPGFAVAMIAFIALNFMLGLSAQPVMRLLEAGIALWA